MARLTKAQRQIGRTLLRRVRTMVSGLESEEKLSRVDGELLSLLKQFLAEAGDMPSTAQVSKVLQQLNTLSARA